MSKTNRQIKRLKTLQILKILQIKTSILTIQFKRNLQAN